MNDSVADSTVGCVFILALLAVSIPLGAFTSMCFWNWYIVPITHFHQIGMAAAFGIGIFISLFRSSESVDSEKQKTPIEQAGKLVTALLMRYGIAWVIAGLIHLFAR